MGGRAGDEERLDHRSGREGTQHNDGAKVQVGLGKRTVGGDLRGMTAEELKAERCATCVDEVRSYLLLFLADESMWRDREAVCVFAVLCLPPL